MSPGCQTFGEDGKAVDDYKGKVAKTTSGLECQMWSEQRPHKHRFEDLGDHNFCRNPDGWPDGVWCYTTDEQKRWELCDVPKCDQGGDGGDFAGDDEEYDGMCVNQQNCMLGLSSYSFR